MAIAGTLAAQTLIPGGLRQRAWFLPNSDGTRIQAISFDAIILESHSSHLNVTSNPVETGVVVADHAFMDPVSLTIEAAVSDFWLHALDANGQKVTDVFSSPVSRAQAAWKLLRGWQAAAEPFSLQTGLELYTNMVIEQLDADQDKDTGTILGFRAQLREVIIVTTQTVTFPPRATGKPARQASKPVSSGDKQPDDAGDPATRESILSSMLGANSPESQAIGNANPDASPALKRLLGPGS